MGDILVAVGSKDTVSEDVSLLARKWFEHPRIVAVTGTDIRPTVVEKASALFVEPDLVLAILDPEKAELEDVKNHLQILKERIHLIIYYTESTSEPPAFLDSKPVQMDTDRDTRLRERVLTVTRARHKKMTDKAFALLKERVKEEAFLEPELNKLLDYAGDKDTIELKDVAAVITETHEETLITLFEAMAQKNHRELIGILENLLSHGLHILAIHSFLIRQIRLLLQAKDIEELFPTEMDYKMFTKTLGTLKEGLDSPPREKKHFLSYQKPYYAFKLSKTSSKSSEKDLLMLYGALVGLEMSIKTGTKYDRIRLETALLEV
jgi:DNA polymerase III delta subunit